MSNHVFNSDSSENLYYLYSDNEDHNKSHKALQKGGNSNKPTGGFPPIYIIDAKEKESELSKNRQIVSSKPTVTIRDILANKKK
jgi:hypothetical protein